MPILIPLSDPQTLTVSSTAVSLTVPARANAALITVESNSIRWWDDGSTPTASAGHLATAGTQVMYFDTGDRDLIVNFKAIRVTSDATLQISYYVYRRS